MRLLYRWHAALPSAVAAYQLLSGRGILMSTGGQGRSQASGISIRPPAFTTSVNPCTFSIIAA